MSYQETQARLELYRRWVEAGCPTDLGQFVVDLGYVIEGADEVQPDLVVREAEHGTE